MSTKTTIKRVALVAAVALTLGGFSSVSANAAYSSDAAGTAAKVSQDASTGDAGIGGVAGPANSLVVNVQQKQDTPTATGNQYGAFVTVTGGTILAAYETTTALTVETGTVGTAAPATGNVSIATGGASATLAGGTVAIRSLRISTPTAGSIVINVYNATVKGANPSSYNSTADATLTLTVNATAVSGTLVVANSTVYDTTTTGSAADANLATAPSVLATSGTARVRYDYALKDANKAGVSKAVSATITGAGLVSPDTSASNAGRSASNASASSGTFYVFGDGSSGTATVTISAGTTVLATKTVSFYSTTVASLKAVTKYSVAAGTAPAGFTGKSTAVYVVAKDATGNEIPSAPAGLTVTSSNTAVATVAVGAYSASAGGTGVGGTAITVTGVAAGTATITVADSTGLIKSTTDVVVTTAVAASVTLSTDAGSYDAGSKVTLNYTAKNAAGANIADGEYILFLGTKPSTNVSVQGAVDSTTLTFVGGVATSTFYAPLTSGNVLVTGGVLGSSASIATALQGTTIADTTFAVNGSADSGLAVDAANAATDAANAAAEEASNATEAASEALAAVNSLATTVASLIAGIKAQLTSLTALIKKIQAKVKA